VWVARTSSSAITRCIDDAMTPEARQRQLQGDRLGQAAVDREDGEACVTIAAGVALGLRRRDRRAA
jgi:hypothetical protein